MWFIHKKQKKIDGITSNDSLAFKCTKRDLIRGGPHSTHLPLREIRNIETTRRFFRVRYFKNVNKWRSITVIFTLHLPMSRDLEVRTN